MVVVFALLGVAVLVTATAPLLLARGSWRVRHPGIAIALWLAAFAAGALSLLGSVASAAVIVMANLHTAWLGAYAPTVASLFVWVGLGALGALIALAVTRSEPMSEAQRSTDSAAFLLAARTRYRVECVGRQHVTYVRDERLLACCTADGRILISSALEETLPANQVRAIVEHERSHLRRRHGRVLQLAKLNAACFPLLPTAREFSRTVSLLSELVADDDAARVCGPATLCNALARVGEATGDAGMLLRAERLAAVPVYGHADRRTLPAVSVIVR
ncbi:M56 family metallopeptidase [Leifsonia sp. L25]|uniref:M56 family metallopeptidase n=1 Tax=Actinomycetes TaxID=1760 RepID=UPI003D689FEC